MKPKSHRPMLSDEAAALMQIGHEIEAQSGALMRIEAALESQGQALARIEGGLEGLRAQIAPGLKRLVAGRLPISPVGSGAAEPAGVYYSPRQVAGLFNVSIASARRLIRDDPECINLGPPQIKDRQRRASLRISQAGVDALQKRRACGGWFPKLARAPKA